MPTIHVQSGSHEKLQEIADTLGRSKKVVVITGAGISTNCGIPDFRSEDGLYSMIQAQYDAALLNPPWETTNTFDIDNRPKKKRKQWFYEVVAADGQVVGVIDEDKTSPKQANEHDLGRPSPHSRSSNTTRTTSRSSTPSRSCDESSLSSCPSIAEETGEEKRDESSCVTISPITTGPSSTIIPPIDVAKSNIGSKTQGTPNLLTQPVNASVGTSVAITSPFKPNSVPQESSQQPTSNAPVLNPHPGLDNVYTSLAIQAPQPDPSPSPSQLLLQEDSHPTTQPETADPLLMPPSGLAGASSPIQSPRTPSRALIGNSSDISMSTELSSSPLSPPPSIIPEVPIPSLAALQSDLASEYSESADHSIALSNPPIAEEPSKHAATSQVQSERKPSTSSSPEPVTTTGSRKRQPRIRIINNSKESVEVHLKSEESSTSTLPSSQGSRASLPNLKGRDLFDAMIWSDPVSTSIFYMFISVLRQRVQDVERTTESHRFLRVLRDGGRLVRNYTQNIDRLEEREGLSTDLHLGPGSKSRFKTVRSSLSGGDSVDAQQNSRGCECVPLHGTLLRLRCQLCSKLTDWDEESRITTTLAGSAPECPSCSEYSAKRASSGRRNLGVGRLRPDIVLYGEENPADNLISPIITHDLSIGPDVLLIMGTSLKVHGLKNMVKEFAKAVHARNGTVVFVNNTEPSQSTWGDVLDYWVQLDCDKWVLDLKKRRADIWLPQGAKAETKRTDRRRDSARITKPQPGTKRSRRPVSIRDDKINGAYITFKILDSLRKAPDADGKVAARRVYWPEYRPQQSAASAIVKPEAKPKSSKAKTHKKKYAPSKEDLDRAAKRKAPYSAEYLDKPDTIAAKVAEYWEKLRELAPGLAPAPKYLRRPFSEMKSNMPESIPPFAFAQPTHIPNVVSDWALARINLVTHPPSSSTIPVHTPPKGERAVMENRKVTHGYGTRASGRQHQLQEEMEDTIVVEEQPQSRTHSADGSQSVTPSMNVDRIRRMGSIGNLVSSPEEEWYDAPEMVDRSISR